jgi:hypothetical protein
VDLFNLADKPPHEVLGDAWTVMLDVRAVYEKELDRCRGSFDHIDWPLKVLAEAHFNCPECSSDLVTQLDSNNTDIQSAKCECRSCGANVGAEKAVERAIEAHFEWDSYIAMATRGFPEWGLMRLAATGRKSFNRHPPPPSRYRSRLPTRS